MKKFNFIYLLLAFVGVLSMTSCEHKYADYTPGAQDKNMGVYFPSTAAFEVTADDTSVEIAVSRLNATDAASVSLRSKDQDESGLFTVPSSVSFEAGATDTNLVVTFDGSALEIGKTYHLNIQIDQAEASSYATSQAVFTITIPEPWNSMGQGIYFDDFLCNLMSEADSFRGAGAYVEFEQHALESNRIRVVDPFAPATIAAMWGGIPSWLGFPTSDTTYIEFDITDPAHVQLANVLEFSDGSKAQVAPLYIQLSSKGTLYDLYLLVWNGADGESSIVLEDGIMKFPADGSVELAAFNGGQYYGYFSKCNPSGYMQYYMPGTEFVNYDIEATYDGMYVSADGLTAKAIFNFLLGADVASYKFAFATGDVTADPSATIDAIVAGSEELTIFEAAADTKRWEVELTKGVYTLVAVPYTAEGEARTQEAFVYNFYFNGTGETPEVDVTVELGVPSELVAPEKAEETEAKTPAPFYIGVKITADPSHLKAIKSWYGNPAAVEQAGLTLDQLFNQYGGDASVWIERLAENDGVYVGGFNVASGTTNTVYLRFETIYGTNVDIITDAYTTPAYDGDFLVGEYAFQDGESQMVFGVQPGKSYTSFLFTHPYVDGSMWHATWDKEASTLTVEGVEYGYESYGNQYGGLFGYFNAEKTQAYGYFSFASEESNGSDPMVFTVAENKLAALTTTFQMLVYDKTTETPSFLGQYFSFSPSTVIVPYSAAEPAAKALSAKASMKQSSFACGEATNVGAGRKAERVIKATPIQGCDFTQAALTLQR